MNIIRLFFCSFIFCAAPVYGIIKNCTFPDTSLYPMCAAYDEGYIRVSDIHTLYYSQHGNAHGIPVLVVHGGPGAGCTVQATTFFDPVYYRIILLDQRGAGKSTPQAEMQENTPQHAVNDIETLRKHLAIEKWILFGGSYGTMLSLLYGETHPERVLGFILRGIKLGKHHEHHNLFFGMSNFFPEAWHTLVNLLDPTEHGNIITALYQRIMNPNPEIHQPIADAFIYYDKLCGTHPVNPDTFDRAAINKQTSLNVTRAFMHYGINNFFLEDNQILNNIAAIAHIPTIIVHGRYDLICLPQNAYELHNNLRNAELWYILDAGHFATNLNMAEALCAATNAMQTRIATH